MTGGARRRRRVRRTRVGVTLDSLRSAPGLSELSDEDFIAYLKSNYPPLVVVDFVRILQASGGARPPAAKAAHLPLTKRKRKGKRPSATRMRNPVTVSRYISHAIVLVVSLVALGRNAPPVVLVLGIAVIGILAAFLIKDVTTSAVAFTIRSRSKASSWQVTVRVKASSLDKGTIALLLRLTSIMMPPEDRAAYVEDQEANLDATGSRYEWLVYLLGQIVGVGQAAWQLYLESRRESAK